MAVFLALAWTALGVFGLIAAFLSGRWILVFAAIFALGYAALWARVVVRGRLLTWREIATPWRR
jgi:hypothetical protein